MSGTSNHYDAMAAIKTLIEGLSLTGSPTVTIQEAANRDDQALPLISISPYGPERLDDEFNDRDGVYYGILVAIIANKDVTALETRLGWRQSIRRKLNNKPLSGLSANYNMKVEPGNAVEVAAYFQNKGFVSGMVVRVYCQETRL